MSRRRSGFAVPLIVAAVGLAGCSGEASPPNRPTATSTSQAAPSTTTARTSTKLTLAGAPAELTTAVSAIYAGQGAIDGKATLGTWHKQQVAVVTAGDDVTLAVAAPTWRVVGGWWPSLNKPQPDLGGKRFVLAIGSDARVAAGDSISRSRADALQLIGQDGSGGGGLLGMARDLWVPLSTGGHGKINAAMVFGGPSAQVAAVATMSGIPVTDYLLMSFDQVTKYTDAMGGLPLVLSTPAHLAGGAGNLSAGSHVLTGAQVLGFARERKSLADGDFGRSRHQGDLVLAAAVKARLAGPGAIPDALTKLDALSASNMDAERMLTFVAGFFVLDPTRVGHAVAKGGFGTSSDGQSIVVLDGASKNAMADFRDGRIGG